MNYNNSKNDGKGRNLMKENIIIAIGRSYGSGGREVGEKLAKRLGIAFYDKQIIELASEKTGMDKKFFDKADERIVSRFVDPYVPEDGDINYKLYMTEFKIINELAKKESFVIVGRLADYILRDNENCFKVFLYAPEKNRIERIMELYHMTKDGAKKEITKMDKARKVYCSYFTNRQWDGSDGRDMMINTSWLGIDGTVDLLETIVQQWRERR